MSERGKTMPAEHAVLGLLALDESAGHGYDLARHFAAGQPLAEIIRLEPAMLYHHLKKLARAEWVTATTELQDSRPPRQVYQLTPAGLAELRRWLAEPVEQTREIRLTFLLKLYFARRLEPALAIRLLTEQHVTLARLAASLTNQLASLSPIDDTGHDPFIREVLELRLAQTRAAADWLLRVAQTSPTP